MVRVLLSTLLVATAVGGCGSGDEPSPQGSPEATATTESPEATATTESAAGGEKVAIRDFKYVPDTITVEAGSKVEWTNEDEAPHTATADDGSFDTGDLREGDTGSVTLRKAGTYEYFCEFHKFMRARVEVR